MQVSAPRTNSPADLAASLYALLLRLTGEPADDHLRAIEDHDLTVSQMRALFVLSFADEPQAGGRIAERLGISAAAASRALDGLVGQGLVERCDPGADRRVRPLAISAAGREVVEELVALKRGQLERFAAALDDRQRELWGAALACLHPEETSR